jgi:hypothetical protein
MSTTGLVFMLAFLASLAFAFVRPIVGLYAYIAVFYVHPPSRWWGEALPDLRWSLLAAAVTLVATLRLPADKGRRSWLATTPARLLIAYTLWLWIQFGWTLSPEAQLDVAVLFSKYVVLFYLIYRLVNTPEDVRRFLLVHAIGCTYLGYLAFTSTVSGRLEGVGGPGIDEANTMAMQFATGLVVGAMAILVDRMWLKIAGVPAMAFVLNGVVLSGSRGAFVALLCAAVVMFYFKPAGYRGLFYLFGALGIVLFAILTPPDYWQRMGTITAAVDDTREMDMSAESRLVLFDAQMRMAAAYPLGSGHRGTEVLSPQYLEEKYLANITGHDVDRTRSSHNTFLTALVEQGVPGALLYVMTWLWAARALLRLRRHSHRHSWPVTVSAYVCSLAGALTIVLVAGQFVDYLKVEVQPWLLAVLASLETLMLREMAAGPQQTPAIAPETSLPMRARPQPRGQA